MAVNLGLHLKEVLFGLKILHPVEGREKKSAAVFALAVDKIYLRNYERALVFFTLSPD